MGCGFTRSEGYAFKPREGAEVEWWFCKKKGLFGVGSIVKSRPGKLKKLKHIM
jgi:hypothetical protein